MKYINMKIQKEKGFYKIHIYCSNCGLELYKESDSKFIILRKTILRDNKIPKYCPFCGTIVR